MATRDWSALHRKADQAGKAAAEAAVPTPMVVYTPKGLFDNEVDTSKPVYNVPEGVCGFAWVNVKDGRSGFARWARLNEVGRTDHYYGGVTIWVSAFGQSMTRKEAYAQAYAKILRENGVDCYSMSRMD